MAERDGVGRVSDRERKRAAGRLDLERYPTWVGTHLPGGALPHPATAHLPLPRLSRPQAIHYSRINQSFVSFAGASPRLDEDKVEEEDEAIQIGLSSKVVYLHSTKRGPCCTLVRPSRPRATAPSPTPDPTPPPRTQPQPISISLSSSHSPLPSNKQTHRTGSQLHRAPHLTHPHTHTHETPGPRQPDGLLHRRRARLDSRALHVS